MEALQVAIENRGGHILRGIVTVPAGERVHPCVVMLHGFGGSASGRRYFGTKDAQYLQAVGGGHDFTSLESRAMVLDVVAAFIKSHSSRGCDPIWFHGRRVAGGGASL